MSATPVTLRLPPSNEAPPSAFLKKYMGALLFSAMLHVVLAGVAIAVFFGGGMGGGVPGDGTGDGPGHEGRMYIAGRVSLQGSDNGGAHTPVHAGHTPGHGETAIPPIRSEEQPVKDGDSSPPEPDAIPIPVQSKLEMERKPPRKERASTSAAVKKKAPQQVEGLGITEPASASQSKGESAAGRGQAQARGNGAGPAGGGNGVTPGIGGGRSGVGSQGMGVPGKVDSKPKVLSRARVTYPESARRNNVTGHVLLRFYLDEKGVISQLQVIKSEPPEIFDKAALAAVKQWRFAPAVKDGRAVPYWVELPMPFILK